MTSFHRALTAIVLAIASVGCASVKNDLPGGQAAYATFPSPAQNGIEDQLIRPGDRLSIRVFGEPELTSEQYRVDPAGMLDMPLAGEIKVAQHKPSEVRDEIARRLAGRYIRKPQVNVSVIEREKSTYSVEGQVREPGIFELLPDTTLLAALASAKSPTNVARNDDIAVFRLVDGQRLGAKFNLNDIRLGKAADPQILAGDTVVVGYSRSKGAFRDVLASAPLFNLFYLFK